MVDFYEFYEGLQEGWDGPALLVFSDGDRVGARLDRNGLRPARYWLTDDDLVYVASEARARPAPSLGRALRRTRRQGRVAQATTRRACGAVIGARCSQQPSLNPILPRRRWACWTTC